MDFASLKFLIVDDHAFLRMMVKNALQPLGVQNLDWAIDGHDALEKITTAATNNRPYDVVFLDWHMPRVDGFDVLSACRENHQFDRMAIVMVTAESEPGNIARAIGAGATAYITKPFQTDAIVKKLHDVAAWRQKMETSIL